eukprot:Selendium_serpulae@DN3432_c0_g1_i3.p2
MSRHISRRTCFGPTNHREVITTITPDLWPLGLCHFHHILTMYRYIRISILGFHTILDIHLFPAPMVDELWQRGWLMQAGLPTKEGHMASPGGGKKKKKKKKKVLCVD